MTVQRTFYSGGGGGGAVDSVNGRTGAVTLAKADVGLNNVNNTADANKQISSATQTALDTKADDSAVTTALAAKVDKGTIRVSVQDFNADSTGATDTIAAFNAALTFAGAGVEVYVPPGIYRMESTLNISAGQTVSGAGWYWQRDGLETFGHANWASNTMIKGAVLRSTVTSGNAVHHVDTTTHTGGGLRDVVIVGPGSGTSVGIKIGRDTPSVRASIGAFYQNVAVGNFSVGYEMHHVNEAKLIGLYARGCAKAASLIHDVNANTWVGLNMQRCTTGLMMESGGSCYSNTFVSPICQNLTGDNWTVRGYDNTWISPYHEHPGNPVGPAYLFNMQSGNRNTVINPDVHVTNPMRILVSSSSHHNTFEMVDVHAARYDIVDDGQSNKFTGDFDPSAPITGAGTNRIIEDRRGAYAQFPRLKYTAGPEEIVGTGHPEGAVTAPVGSLYRRTNPATAADPVFFWKASGSSTTGWRPIRPFGSEDELVAAGELWPNRERITSGTVATTSGVLLLSYYTAQKTETINTITLYSGTTAAAATPTLVRAGIYSVAANGDVTLVASIPNDTTIFAAAQTAYTRTLSAPFNKVAGVRYAVGVIVVTGVAMPNFHGHQLAPTGVMNTLTREAPALCGRVTTQTDLPASVANASIVGFQAMVAMRLNP